MSDKELQDLKDLFEKGLLSKEAYDDAVSKLKANNAKSEVDQLKSELGELKKRKEKLIEDKNQAEVAEPDDVTSTIDQKEVVSKNTLIDFLVSNKIIIGLLAVSIAIFYTQSGNTVSSELENPEGIEVEVTVPETNYIVENLQDVSKAVVRISALGAVADTDNEEVGTGSGFFISNDGYIITNNHVVAGAQGLEVSTYESDIKIPAQIVGRSECKDLAVIKIEGNDYKYLSWYQDEITPGLEVYAAGYPLSTEEYTLLDGIVSKKRADGENNWASVDEVVEHTANILPGNSGGPLVTKNGKVVAVNYSVIIDYGQSFAISSNLASTVTSTLIEGEDILSIGINPEAYIDEEYEIIGIFVTAVEPNSIASRAGIISGDFLLNLDGNEVGVDGLMTSYCNQLENWDFQTPIPFTIYRPGTDEFLEGELLGSPVESLNIPPVIDLEVCPTSLRIGETYDFNILFIEGTSEATSISVIFTDSTGNFEVDIEPQQYIEPIDIDGQTVYAGNFIKSVYFEGTKNIGVVRGSIIDRSGLSNNFECEIDLIIPVTTTTTTVPKT
ncbi:S1C family serine protease, partial [Acidimicrobiia bacterium]|nr:S1C family serine protease [Acidimicrobiia bacterium]